MGFPAVSEPAYVLLPFSTVPPAEALRLSLAPFERGGRGQLPKDKLAFHDETGHLRALHAATFTFTTQGGGLRMEGDVDSWGLDLDAVRREMASRGVARWRVCFQEDEPDVDAFAARFVPRLERHPVSGGYGRWLNPLGRWDWWDLGGRFDGRIQGERRRPAPAASMVSSGPNAGRTALGAIAGALSKALASDPPSGFVAEADANVELVSRLQDDLMAGLDHAVPGAVVLPPGACEDKLRWIETWPTLGPEESLSMLGQETGAEWRDVLRAVYERYADHWAANVAYHF